MEPIATALEKLKVARGLTDTELWAAAGVSPGCLSRYLHGTRGSAAIDKRGARTIEKFAQALGVSPDYFIEWRAWAVREIARQQPELIDDIYDLLVELARRSGVTLDSGPK